MTDGGGVSHDAAAPAVSPLIRVQHHPSRARLLGPLAAACGSLPVSVIEDPDPHGKPSPLRCYRECVGRPAPEFTHLIVLQDDVQLCDGFDVAATAAIADFPDSLVALFVGGAPRRSAREIVLAHGRGDRYCTLAAMDWVPTVALVWPSAVATEFSRYLKRVSPDHWADDPIVGNWVHRSRRTVVATVPSLVQHPDVEESLLPRRQKRVGAGRNPDRVAAVFTGSWP